MPDLNQTITIKAEGKLPGEELAVAIINLQMKRLEYMTAEQRKSYLDRVDNFEQFWDNLLAPLRNLVEQLQKVGK